jgi:cytochrome P450
VYRPFRTSEYCADFFAFSQNLSDDEILGNSAALLIAGSETTATLLAGLTYLLCKHPEAMSKLKQEVRSKFTSDSEITLASVLELKYLLACLDEALRLYPPVPIGPPRTVPAGSGGVTIAGHVVPGGTDVAVWHWPMFHYSEHWEKPMEYRPERFLQEDSSFGPRYAGDIRYNNTNGVHSGDRLDLLQPFSVGPRNCLGRNLAYSEMRLVLARVIFNFDMELVEPEDDWMGKQRADFLWHKRPLHVHLSPVTV